MLAIILTRWINLGPCLSPDDHHWRVHARNAENLDTLELDMTVSPRVSFENCAGDTSIEALRRHNLSLLKEKNYKGVMKKLWWNDDIWFSSVYHPTR